MSASKLVRPSAEYRESYFAALDEYHREGRYLYNQVEKLAQDFDGFVQTLRCDRGQPHQPYQHWVDQVPETILWMVKDEDYIGSVNIRHRLNWHLEKWGGHIHFVVRPSFRRKGFGRKMLMKAMPFANYLGIDQALLTIAPDNQPALRVAVACGAVADDLTTATDQFPAMQRFWLDCT